MNEKALNVRDNSLKQRLAHFFRSGGGMVAVMLLMFVVMCFVSPYFLTKSNIVSLLKSAVSTALLAYAMTFVLIAGEIDLSISSMFALSAMVACYLMNRGLSFFPALLLTLLVAVVVGLFNGFIVGYTRIPAFIVTLATQRVIRGIVYLISGGQPITSREPTFAAIGSQKIGLMTYPIAITIVITIILAILLKRTIYGRKIYACGGNREAAVFSGINAKRIVISVFVISAVVASLAGILSASRICQAQPVAGDGYEADAIAAAVLGGTSFTGGAGSIMGTAIGALVLALLQNGLNLIGVSYYWQLVVQGLLIIGAVYMDTAGRK